MKRTCLFSAIAIAALSVAAVSCTEKDETPKTTDNVIECTIPEGSVNVGESVTFNDNSLNVQSRLWTFQDATPATSDEAAVSVAFNSAGSKAVTLEVTFTDGFTLKKEMTVTVVDPIRGTLKVSDTTPMGCIRIADEVTFSIDGLSGSPDKYSWTFEGGTPATSTEASPKVKFDKRIRSAKVTCTLKREADGASVVLENNYVVGNYPVTRVLDDYEIDNFSFEQKNLGGWIAWTNKGANRGTTGTDNIFSIVEGGANGTGHCLKVDLTKLTVEGDGEFADLFPRDAWACNAHLEAGKTYELTFWCNGDGWVNEAHWVTPCAQIINWLEDWMTVDGTDLTAGAAWGKIFTGEEFAAEGNTVIKEVWWDDTIGRAPEGWTQCRLEFTANADMHNVYPYFRVYVGYASALYFDEIEINLIEE